MSKEFNLEALSSKINRCKQELKKIDTEEKIKKYGTFFDSKQEIMLREIIYLEELRDTLLPKLISGELRIPDAEKIIEEIGI